MKSALPKSKEFERYLHAAISLISANETCSSDLECDLVVVLSSDFFANFDGRKLLISSGLIDEIAQQNSKSSKSYDESLAYTWLILHELSHFKLGHFNLANSFGIARRSSTSIKIRSVLPEKIRFLAPLCLEMQADHEATDLLLGVYATDDWQRFRAKVLAISGVIMLIELEDTKVGAEGRTHPRAATRIFQLLGHLSEMPLVQPQVSQDVSLIPNEKELKAFAHEVTIPCFFDAIQLTQAAGASSIASDLGSLEDFFKDLEIVKLGDPSRYGELKTQGAQEWAKLWPCNEALKSILGSHFTT